MAFDVDSAKKAGYSDQEISDFLAKQHPNFDIQGAIKAGYSLKEIGDRTNQPAPQQQSGLDKTVGVINAVKAPFQKVGNAVGQALQPGMQVAQQAMQGTIPGMGMQAMNAAQNLYEQGGQAAAEALPNGVQMAPGQTLKTNPATAATIGTGIAMTPQIAMAAQGIASAPEMAQAISSPLKAAGNKIGNFVDVLKAPGQAEAQTTADQMMQRFIPNQAQSKLRQLATGMMQEPVENLQAAKSAMAEIPSQQADKASQLEQMRLSAGKQIGQAETELAPKFKSTPEFENFIADRQKVATFAQKLGKLGDMTPEDIQAKYSDADLMNIRKISQEAAKKGTLSDIGNTDLNTINQQASKALEVSSQKLGMARSTYKGILDKIDGLPAETKARTAAYKQYIIGEQGKLNAIKSQIKDLNMAAKEADAQELADIQSKTQALVQKGLQHDKTIKYLKNGAIGAAVGVTGLGAVKHYL